MGDQLSWHRTYSSGEGEISRRWIAEAAVAGWWQSDVLRVRRDGTNRSLTTEAKTVTPEELAWVTSLLEEVFPDVQRHEPPLTTKDEMPDCRRTRLHGRVPESFVARWQLDDAQRTSPSPPSCTQRRWKWWRLI